MKVKELIEKVKQGEHIQDVLDIKKFVSTSKKDLSADALVETIAFLKNGIVSYDTNELELHTDITAIQLYTDLEFDNLLEDYDLLLEYELLDKIAESVGVDYVRYIRMIENKLDDLCRENNTVEGILANNLVKVSTKLEDTLQVVSDKLSEANVKDISSSIGVLTREIIKVFPSMMKQ